MTVVRRDRRAPEVAITIRQADADIDAAGLRAHGHGGPRRSVWLTPIPTSSTAAAARESALPARSRSSPKFIVCDEPVSALDVSIQAQILNLMMDLQEKMELTYMFITHDLSVVKHISDDIVRHVPGQARGKVRTVEELFKNQLHPYTKALLSAIPRIDIDNPSKRTILRGEITSPIDPKPGCRFAPRCPYATKACFEQDPELRELAPGHFVSCHRAEEIRNGTAEAIHA